MKYEHQVLLLLQQNDIDRGVPTGGGTGGDPPE
jgi:hypothetical protein